MAQPLMISHSEMRTWASCRRQWYLAYYRGLRPKAEPPTGVVHVGSHIHLALEGYHGYDLDPLAVLRWSYDDVLAQRPEYEDQLRKDYDLAVAMVEGYVQWASAEGLDAGLEVVATEHQVDHEVTLPVSKATVVWRGKLDVLLRRESDLRYQLRDYKPQPVSEKVLTPSGWVKMGELKPGDFVVGGKGGHHKVVAVHDRGVDDVYKITFNDGTSARATSDHPWYAKRTPSTKFGIVQTSQMSAGSQVIKYEPAQDDADIWLPIEPYALGAWLANGDRRGRGICDDVIEPLLATGLEIRTSKRAENRKTLYTAIMTAEMRKHLEGMTLLMRYSEERFIPELYLNASYRQRLALLRGLMDGDGAYNPRFRSTPQYTTVSPRLAADVANLVRSLGGWAKTWVNTKPTYTGTISRCVFIRSSFNPFLHVKHAEEWEETQQRIDDEVTAGVRSRGGAGVRRRRSRPNENKIVRSIEPDGQEEVRCIQIDSDDHLYVTSGYTVTHNTVGGFAKASALLLDTQMRFYSMLLAFAFPDAKDRATEVLYLMIKRSKRTARATGPFFQQVGVSYNRNDLNSTYLRAIAISEEIITARRRLDGSLHSAHSADHRFTCYPTPSDFCTWGCSFYATCPLFDDGSRVEDALSAHYEVAEPYRYYDDDRIKRAVAALTGSHSPA